jgi:hypothetical protein
MRTSFSIALPHPFLPKWNPANGSCHLMESVCSLENSSIIYEHDSFCCIKHTHTHGFTIYELDSFCCIKHTHMHGFTWIIRLAMIASKCDDGSFSIRDLRFAEWNTILCSCDFDMYPFVCLYVMSKLFLGIILGRNGFAVLSSESF